MCRRSLSSRHQVENFTAEHIENRHNWFWSGVQQAVSSTYEIAPFSRPGVQQAVSSTYEITPFSRPGVQQAVSSRPPMRSLHSPGLAYNKPSVSSTYDRISAPCLILQAVRRHRSRLCRSCVSATISRHLLSGPTTDLLPIISSLTNSLPNPPSSLSHET